MERYSKILPIRGIVNEKKSHVKFSLSTHNFSGNTQLKEIVMQLTKDDNPLFFYTHRMTEEEFRQFKIQQDLKVDFASFPQMVIDLLESVLAEDSKFYLSFDENFLATSDGFSGARRNLGILKIVQSAGHKDLTHLMLKFSPADSKQIQGYLSDTILHLKRRQGILEKQLRQTESNCKSQCQIFEETLAKRNEELETLKNEHESVLVQLKEESERKRQEIRRTVEHERVELEEKCVRLEEENRDLHEQLRTSSADLETVREEFNNLNEEVSEIRQRMEDYKREVIEMEKIRNELQTRLESAEEDVETKDIELDQLKHRYQGLLDEKRKLEHSLHEWTGRARKFEELYNAQRGETDKAVQIMHKCVGYSNAYKDKSTKAELIAKKQQEILKNMETEIAQLRSENERLTKETDDLKAENKTLSAGLTGLQRQTHDQATILAEKESVIVNLSKQCGDFRYLSNVGARSTLKDQNPAYLASASSTTTAMNAFSVPLGADRLNTLKTVPASNAGLGKENKTPFLHPKHSIGPAI